MVKHTLKDGTVLDDIKGHVVKIEDAELAYAVMERINEREKNREQD